MGRIKLFCFPYAGGMAMIYSKWKKYLNQLIELIPIELAGRGQKCNLPFYNSFDEAVDDAYNIIKNDLDKPYAFFGHSMGGLLAYELELKIRQTKNPIPLHIFLSGRETPNIEPKLYIHTLSDPEFIDEIVRVGGTPREFLEEKELREIFLPLLRADYKIIELYPYNKQHGLLDSDITVLNGTLDQEIELAAQTQWKQFTKGKLTMHNFEGGHFFIHDNIPAIVNIINRTLIPGIV